MASSSESPNPPPTYGALQMASSSESPNPPPTYGALQMASSSESPNPPPTYGALQASQPTERINVDYMYYRPLYKAAVEGNWERARSFFSQDSEACEARISQLGETALAIAAGAGQTNFVEEIVKLMSPESLLFKDIQTFTALHNAATIGSAKAAKALVGKNPELTQIRNKYEETPLLRAALYGRKELVWYLYKVTRDVNPSPFRGQDGATLLSATISADLYDVALRLLHQYPEVATTKDNMGRFAIHILASKSWSFPSQHELWNRCGNLLLEVSNDLFANILTRVVPSMKNLYEAKVMHRQYLKLVDCICSHVLQLNNGPSLWGILNGTVLAASQHGNVELIKSVLDTDPSQIWSYNQQTHSMLHIAVKFRQERVFNTLKDMGGFQDAWASWRDDTSWETISHLAAKLAPPNKLNQVSGAALQVQYELQWYKEVEKIVQPLYRNWKNLQQKSPRELFTEEHKDLVEKGEKWMKDMASSSMVVATLISTVVFTAAFTVPGGNISDGSDKGSPIFLKKRSFMVFAVSNALALFSSLTSVLMFLSILTARFAEEDFIKSLPQKLIIGLAMLFIAIATMTIAFSATYFIMLGHQLAWVSLLIALLACFPVTLFAFLQFPLFLEMILSTYRSTL